MKQVGFIGMGNMGYAIAKGLKSTNPDLKIVFHSNTAEKMQKISEELDIRSVEDNRTVVKEAKYIILAVKPQVFDEIFAEISDSIRKEHVIISLAPGFTIKQLNDILPNAKIVRTMPNTPALVGEGMTGITYHKEEFSFEEEEMLLRIFSSIGKVKVVDEKNMDAVVCASGSSPAYVFMFMEALADSAVQCGLKRADAYEFVAQAVLGSAKLMQETGMHPGELKDMVCSPGGTTIAGVEALEQNGFRKSIFCATDACNKKCKNI